MSMSRIEFYASVALTAIAVPSMAYAEDAQVGADTADNTPSSEIVVTARKKAETLISVPVAVSAVTASSLETRAVSSIDDIVRFVPGVIVGGGGGTLQGGPLVMRGIGAAETNTLSEQAVAYNFDGIQVARSSPRRLGTFDIAQVEVLKGPQAVLYGRNSPGGVISYRTKDPTDRFEAGARVGYEFAAHEVRGEGYVSGPLADGLGLRLAVYGSDMRGWVRSTLPRNFAYAPASEYGPNQWEIAARGTLKWDNGGPFTARGKFSYGRVRGISGISSTFQYVGCPNPTPQQTGVPGPCRPGDTYSGAGPGTNYGALNAFVGNSGELPYKSDQYLASWEMSYQLDDHVKLTNITGYYRHYLNALLQTGEIADPNNTVFSAIDPDHPVFLREVSNETRLSTDFDAPINVVLGIQYLQSKGISGAISRLGNNTGGTNKLGLPSGSVIGNFYIEQLGKAYSTFGQVQLKPIDKLEITVGARVSHEEKRIPFAFNGNPAINLVGTAPALSNGRQKRKFDDTSPEATISYRPNSDLNLYASYKRGFLSGGFNGGGFTPANLSYEPQLVKGFEAGVKANALNGDLGIDLAAFTYKIIGMQVNVTVGIAQILSNAATARSQGLELTLNYRAPIEGLRLTGSVAYLDAKYKNYFASCWAGQPAPACSLINGSKLQDLSGTRMLRTPEWSGNVGFDYNGAISDTLKLNLNGGLAFSSSYFTDAASDPLGKQKAYGLLDAAVAVARQDDRWTVSLIGKNLTDRYYVVRSASQPLGGVNPRGDVLGDVSRGRQVMVQVGFKY